VRTLDRLLEIIKKYENLPLQTEDGDDYTLKLMPAMSEADISASEKGLQLIYPPAIRDTLRYTRGFETSPIESIDFSGMDNYQDYQGLFLQCLGIAHDGFGNYWILDLSDPTFPSGCVYYVAHDPPVVIYQTSSLSHFVEEVLKMGHSPFGSEIDDVHEKFSRRVWRENPSVLSYEQCLDSSDMLLKNFAQNLDESWLICDLRNPEVGDGFSWGRFGPNTKVQRFGNHPVFAYQKRESWFSRLFGKK
jgi:hypothetical protein